MSVLKFKNAAISLFLFTMLVFTASTFAQTTTAGTKGSGKSAGAKSTLQHGSRFVDANGDGICDNAIDTNGDGIPDQKGNAKRPMDGTGKKNGMGKGHGTCLKGSGQGTGTGVCDGTGPKGKMGSK